MNVRASLVGMAAATLACNTGNGKPPLPSDTARLPSVFEDIVPTTGGHAYAVALTGGVWYLTGTQARPVRVIGDSTTREDFARSVLLEVQPTSDGGAYAFGMGLDHVWRLDADSALAVNFRGRALTTVSVSDSLQDRSFAFALYTRERNNRMRAEKLNEPSPP